MLRPVSRASLLAATLALTALVAFPTADALYETVVYNPTAFSIPGCFTTVVGARDPVTLNWVFEVTLVGVCPFATGWVDTCIAPFWESVGFGFNAFCSSGATFVAGGTGVYPWSPSFVTLFAWWEYGFCPNPQPNCVTTFGDVHWTV